MKRVPKVGDWVKLQGWSEFYIVDYAGVDVINVYVARHNHSVPYNTNSEWIFRDAEVKPEPAKDTYHVLFAFGGRVAAFAVATTQEPPMRVLRYANLILKNPPTRVFVKDRYDLQGKYETVDGWSEVIFYIEGALGR